MNELTIGRILQPKPHVAEWHDSKAKIIDIRKNGEYILIDTFACKRTLTYDEVQNDYYV
jgi:hypothetical protein